MRSAFYGIHVATQGLYTARTALDVTNHNISNAETPGYSRQYAVQQACRAYPNGGKGMMGSGSEILNIERYRDSYLDNKYWSFMQDLGQFQTKFTQLEQLEIVFNEPTETGLVTQFDYFMAAMDDLSTDFENKKGGFIEKTNDFTQRFNDVAKQLRMYQRDANFGIKNKVDEINLVAKQLASVNDQIANLELNGSHANDLRDQRVKLIDQLSKIVNTRVDEVEDMYGKKDTIVYINGHILVDGNHASFLEVRTRDYLHNPEDELDLYDVYWESGKVFDITDPKLTGELKGYVDIRDGNNGQNFISDAVSITVATKQLRVNNYNRTDIPNAGFVEINNQLFEYTSYTYDPLNKWIDFDLVGPLPTQLGSVTIGDTMEFKGIPYYMNRLNEFVRTLSIKLNAVHKTGNNNTAGELFSYKGYIGAGLDELQEQTYDVITADNFMIDQRILDDPNQLAASTNPDLGPSLNDIILGMLDIKHNNHMFDKGTPGNYLQALIGELGIDSKQAESFKDGQTNLSTLADNQRLAYSGVDLNEETMNILRFQHAYSLAAKMISVMDEIYDVTINRMGV